MSLGPWVHLIEELQLFDQEPMGSLVLAQSKVVSWALSATVPSTVLLALSVWLLLPVGPTCLASAELGTHTRMDAHLA